MHLSINMVQIFPIRDEPSARLMSLKAECLLMAGVISEHEEQAVLGKAAKVLAVSDRPSVGMTRPRRKVIAMAKKTRKSKVAKKPTGRAKKLKKKATRREPPKPIHFSHRNSRFRKGSNAPEALNGGSPPRRQRTAFGLSI
jgi:hypothetical protein